MSSTPRPPRAAPRNRSGPPAQPSAMGFFSGRGCTNTTLWRYRIENPGGGSPDMRYDYNLNDCRDDWEGDGTRGGQVVEKKE